jgi:hypothetical protein
MVGGGAAVSRGGISVAAASTTCWPVHGGRKPDRAVRSPQKPARVS